MGPARIFPSLAAGTLALGLAGAEPARADHQPAIAVPGNPQVPVIVDGVDASYGYVGGDWGLYRPGHARPLVVVPVYRHRERQIWGYFPSTGRKPGYGRQETTHVHGRPPAPAPTYYRSWSTAPDLDPRIEYPPYNPPPVILAPDGVK